jgi:hypothetical protein
VHIAALLGRELIWGCGGDTAVASVRPYNLQCKEEVDSKLVGTFTLLWKNEWWEGPGSLLTNSTP